MEIMREESRKREEYKRAKMNQSRFSGSSTRGAYISSQSSAYNDNTSGLMSAYYIASAMSSNDSSSSCDSSSYDSSSSCSND